MKVQIMSDVVAIFVVLVPNLLHHNNVGVTYVGTSKFKMEPIRSVPLYYVAMLQSMVTGIEAPFVTTPTHIVISMGFKPQTPPNSKGNRTCECAYRDAQKGE